MKPAPREASIRTHRHGLQLRQIAHLCCHLLGVGMHLGGRKVQDDDAVIRCDKNIALVHIPVHDACLVDPGQSLSQVLVQCPV